MKSGNIDIQAEVTNKIVEAIEAGAATFQMPWHQPGLKPPKNYVSGNTYRGTNFLSLMIEQHLQKFTDNRWATFKQWHEIGGRVRKGERGTPIIFYKLLPIKSAEEGSPTDTIIPLLRYSYVFNYSQVEALNSQAEVVETFPVDPIENADRIIASTGAIIRHEGQRAYYHPKSDEIFMPTKDLWTGTDTSTAQEAYYSTLFHELTHWVGAAHRLNREGIHNRSQEHVAFEELVAELGAAFACVQIGITPTARPDHAAYIASWIKVLKNDKRAIFQASAAASRAVDYIIEGPASREVRQAA